MSISRNRCGRAWRFRRCPACAVVLAASEFVAINYGSSWTPDGGMRRRCPECGYRASTWRFQVVREKRGVGR